MDHFPHLDDLEFAVDNALLLHVMYTLSINKSNVSTKLKKHDFVIA